MKIIIPLSGPAPPECGAFACRHTAAIMLTSDMRYVELPLCKEHARQLHAELGELEFV